MALSLLTNIESLVTQTAMEKTDRQVRKSIERIATGHRITEAADDPAGLAISDRLKGEKNSVDQAHSNTIQALSVLQVAEGGLNDISNVMLRLRELATQAANDDVDDSERADLSAEANELKSAVDQIALGTRFGRRTLLDGSAGLLTFQVGPRDTDEDRISFDANVLDSRAALLGVEGLDLSDEDSSREAIDALDAGFDKLNLARAQLGGVQQRLQITAEQLATYSTNLGEAASRISDTDYANEVSTLVRSQILQRAQAALLSQANAQPIIALHLLDY